MRKIDYMRGLLGLLFVLLSWAAQAQIAPPPLVRPDSGRAIAPPETAEARRKRMQADSARRTEHLFRIKLAPKRIAGLPFPGVNMPGLRLSRPGKAALLSALLPGTGQIYNHSWLKLPLVYGGLGAVIYGESFYQKYYREFADAYNAVGANPALLGNPSLGTQASLARSLDALNNGVIAYRRQRDIFYLYIGLVYGVQILDALVTAHLKDFDVSDDLSLHWEPTLMAVPGQPLALPTTPGLQLALRVK